MFWSFRQASGSLNFRSILVGSIPTDRATSAYCVRQELRIRSVIAHIQAMSLNVNEMSQSVKRPEPPGCTFAVELLMPASAQAPGSNDV